MGVVGLERGSRLGKAAQPHQGAYLVFRVAMVVRFLGKQFRIHRRGKIEAVFVVIGAGEVVFQFGDTLPYLLLYVVGRGGDVAERDQLFHGFRRRMGVEAGVWGMLPRIAAEGFPCRNCLHRGRVLEGVDQNLAVHILPDRKPVQVQ